MAVTEKIFYSAVTDKVANILTARKQYHSADVRDSNAHEWLYRKMAYAIATATNKNTNQSASLKLSEQGGIGPNSLYDSPKTANYTIYSPKPHIVSVKISNEGDFGSLKKCEISFSVYNIADLDSMQPFFDIGADLTIEYGWSITSPAANTGTFIGKLYNFSYSVNVNGGFNCIAYGIGEGLNALAGNIKSSITPESANSSINDFSYLYLNNAILDLNLPGYIEIQIAQLKTHPDNVIDLETGISMVTLPDSLKDSKYTDSNSTIPNYYITLEKLVDIVNKKILNDSKSKIVCNQTVTKGIIPANSEYLISANPGQILFPGYANYGDGANFLTGNFPEKLSFAKGDLSKILLNVFWLKSIYNEIGLKTLDRQKSADQTIAKFFTNIFDSILNNSGTRFKLTLVSDPNDETKILIADINYVETKGVKACELTAVNKFSICRNVTLSSKVPAEFATAAFVANANTLTTQSSKSGQVLGTVKKVDVVDETTLLANLRSAKQAMVGTKKKESDISNLQSILKQVYEYTINVPNGQQIQLGEAPKESIPFPLNFSATLDGIEGFVFGNVVTSNYLPMRYQQKGSTEQEGSTAFTVTKVEHVIANNDWTTTIQTVCRLIPPKSKTDTKVPERNNAELNLNIPSSNVPLSDNTAIKPKIPNIATKPQ